jgi:nicotinamide riboside transporter PnuC
MAISDWLSNNWIEVFGAITGIIYVFLEIRQNIWLWPVGITTSAVYIIVFFSSKFYADMSLQVYYLVISCVGWYWWVKGVRRQATGEGQRAGDWKQKEENRGMGEGEKVEASGLPSLEGAEREEKPRGLLSEEPACRGDVVVESGVGSNSTGQRAKGTVQGVNSPFEGVQEDVKLRVTRLKLKTGIILAITFVILYFLLWFVLSRLTDSPVPEWDSFITTMSIIATWMLARKIYEHWFLWIVVNSASSVIFLTRGLYPTVILYLVYLAMSFVGLKAWKRTL